MLQRLEIQNVAIIDRVGIEFGAGLNVLTGETGAGKSIIIDSINAILGERLSKDLIRTGKEKAVVEAVFEVDNERFADLFEMLGIEPEEDGTLIISREFTTAGKNTCRVNGKMATVSTLKQFGERLIDIHGQHDNQSLLRTESHIDLLDLFVHDQIQALLEEYTSHLLKYKELKTRLKMLSGDKNERARKIDLLNYQIDEIKKAKLKEKEEIALEKQRDILINSEKIMAALSKAYELLGQSSKVERSASDSINEVLSELNGISDLDENYNTLTKRLEALSYELDDIVTETRRLRDEVEYNPDLLEQIEERLDLIYRLKKKYGDSVKDILEYMKKASEELNEIVNNEEIVNGLLSQIEKENDLLCKAAAGLSEQRARAAKILEDKIGEELNDLEMKNARFKVNIDFDASYNNNNEIRYNHNGLDKVEFLISSNPGEPLKPLSKIASGGEMSRIMLAIKTILANVDKMPTLIFDEIDIGISGKASQKVGEKLSFISKNHQVISVTHLAQIACMGDSNYYIEKISKDNNTNAVVSKLDKNELKNEIARIIGGANISEITLKHAEEMLLNAVRFKKSDDKVRK
ncbi:MAG: DNA repair protein RecN [Clostridiaceae bacterium]|nr:DNA repair protein RecN [Clostridiaceae bacterium]